VIHVVAIVTATPGMRDAVLQEVRANVPAVRAEQGCIEYQPTIDAEGAGSIQARVGPDTFVVIEKWESVDALRAHAAAPHVVSYAAKTRVLCRPS
jgi:quinol monooxygenase YgiN